MFYVSLLLSLLPTYCTIRMIVSPRHKSPSRIIENGNNIHICYILWDQSTVEHRHHVSPNHSRTVKALSINLINKLLYWWVTLVQLTRRPMFRACWVIGNEKVNPRGRDSLAVKLYFSRKVFIHSAKKRKRSSPGPSLLNDIWQFLWVIYMWYIVPYAFFNWEVVNNFFYNLTILQNKFDNSKVCSSKI